MESKDLHDLVEAITKDKDGDLRLTEELTTKDIYKKNYPNHAKYWELVAAEIQCFELTVLPPCCEVEKVFHIVKCCRMFMTKPRSITTRAKVHRIHRKSGSDKAPW